MRYIVAKIDSHADEENMSWIFNDIIDARYNMEIFWQNTYNDFLQDDSYGIREFDVVKTQTYHEDDYASVLVQHVDYTKKIEFYVIPLVE